MSDVLQISKEVIDLFEKHDLSRIQSAFVLEAVRLGIQEGIMKDIIEDSKKGYDLKDAAGIH